MSTRTPPPRLAKSLAPFAALAGFLTLLLAYGFAPR